MTAAEKDEPTAGEYAALLAILEKLGQGAPPIPLWSLSGAGLTTAQLKAALHGLEVRAEAGRSAAAWTAGRS